MKFKSIPIIQETMSVAASDCETYYRRKSFRTLDKQKHILAVPGRTIIRSFDAGEISDEGDVSCKGQAVKESNGKIIDRSIEMSQYSVTIRQEMYELRGNQIDVVTNHIQLPRSCKLNSAFCATTDASYLWTIPRSRCSLEKIQDVSFTAESSGYLVDHSHKILLKVSHPQPAPERCPITQILSTEYPDLFLAIDNKARFHDLGNNLEVDTYARALADYSMYISETKIAMASNLADSALCQQNFAASDVIHSVDGKGRFATRKGQVVFAFRCSSKEGQVATKTECYDDIPLKTGGFVDPYTKIFKRKSPKVPCSDYHPLMVKSKEAWIKINPIPKSISAPKKSSIRDYEVSQP